MVSLTVAHQWQTESNSSKSYSWKRKKHRDSAGKNRLGCLYTWFCFDLKRVVEQKYFVPPCSKESESFYILHFVLQSHFLSHPTITRMTCLQITEKLTCIKWVWASETIYAFEVFVTIYDKQKAQQHSKWVNILFPRKYNWSQLHAKCKSSYGHSSNKESIGIRDAGKGKKSWVKRLLWVLEIFHITQQLEIWSVDSRIDMFSVYMVVLSPIEIN